MRPNTAAALAFIVTAALGTAAQAQPVGTNIGYPTPEAAIQALHARPDVIFTVQNGWVIAKDRANVTNWAFPPTNDPAFPAAVKRQVVQTDTGSISIATNILCGGTQVACDQLASAFHTLNQQAAAQARNQ